MRHVCSLEGRNVHDLVELFSGTHIFILRVDLAKLGSEVDARHEHFLSERHQLQSAFFPAQA